MAVSVLTGIRAFAIIPTEFGLTAQSGACRNRQRTGLQVTVHDAGLLQIDE
jgi:hypothetical protein